MTVPGGETTHLVMVQPHIFSHLEVLLNAPARSAGQHHLLQAGPSRSKHQEILFVLWIGEAATDKQEMTPVVFPTMQDGHKRPVKASRSLGSFTHAQPVPVVRRKRERFDLADPDPPAPTRSVQSDWLMTGYSQHVAVP